MKRKNTNALETVNATVNAVENIDKIDVKIDFTKLTETLKTLRTDTTVNGYGTKRAIVTACISNGMYTTTTATDTVNANDLYIQLNTTDKPRIWLQKSGFKFQYDKNAKRDNRTEYYESIATEYDFKYGDTPSFGNRNRTSDTIPYDKMVSFMTRLYTDGVIIAL